MDDQGDTDRIIGQNVRLWRQRRGLTLDELAETCGVTKQQLQKYEQALDRVPASRLVALARTLELPFELFLAGVDDVEIEGDPREIARIQRAAGMLSRVPEPFRSLLEQVIAGFCRAAPEIAAAQTEGAR